MKPALGPSGNNFGPRAFSQTELLPGPSQRAHLATEILYTDCVESTLLQQHCPIYRIQPPKTSSTEAVLSLPFCLCRWEDSPLTDGVLLVCSRRPIRGHVVPFLRVLGLPQDLPPWRRRRGRQSVLKANGFGMTRPMTDDCQSFLHSRARDEPHSYQEHDNVASPDGLLVLAESPGKTELHRRYVASIVTDDSG